MGNVNRDAPRRTLVFRVSPALFARAQVACARRGVALGDLVRDGVALAAQARVDSGFLPAAASCVDAAGKLFNSAAKHANTCRRRYGEPSALGAKDLRSLERLLEDSAADSAAASSALAPLCRAASDVLSASCVVTDELMSKGERRFTRTVGVRLSGEERAALEPLAARPSEALRLALAVACLEPGEGLVLVADPPSVAALNLSVVRWRVNAGQIREAVAQVAAAHSSSRYLTDAQAASVRARAARAREQADAAMATLARATAPLAAASEEARAERGVAMLFGEGGRS